MSGTKFDPLDLAQRCQQVAARLDARSSARAYLLELAKNLEVEAASFCHELDAPGPRPGDAEPRPESSERPKP